MSLGKKTVVMNEKQLNASIILIVKMLEDGRVENI